jgi:hypothetical protein
LTTEEKPTYQAFVLRCWREEGNEWRVRLQDVQTGEQIGFTDPELLLEYLQRVFGISQSTGP